MYCTQNNGNCATCSLVSYGRDCHNNPVNYKRASVRLPEEMFKIFSKRLVDDGLTAQAFFSRKVEEYIKEAD
jgi:hypothetical protein